MLIDVDLSQKKSIKTADCCLSRTHLLQAFRVGGKLHRITSAARALLGGEVNRFDTKSVNPFYGQVHPGELAMPIDLAAPAIDNHYLAVNTGEIETSVTNRFADWLRNEISTCS